MCTDTNGSLTFLTCYYRYSGYQIIYFTNFEAAIIAIQMSLDDYLDLVYGPLTDAVSSSVTFHFLSVYVKLRKYDIYFKLAY